MRFLAVLIVCGCLTGSLAAQTRADSAAIVLDAARALQREGRSAAARELLRLIRARFDPSTTFRR